MTPEDKTLWFSCPWSVQQVVPLLSRGQRGKPVKEVLPRSEAQKLAKGRLVLENPHENFLSLPMTTCHRPATENSTPVWHRGKECYPAMCRGRRSRAISFAPLSGILSVRSGALEKTVELSLLLFGQGNP